MSSHVYALRNKRGPPVAVAILAVLPLAAAPPKPDRFTPAELRELIYLPDKTREARADWLALLRSHSRPKIARLLVRCESPDCECNYVRTVDLREKGWHLELCAHVLETLEHGFSNWKWAAISREVHNEDPDIRDRAPKLPRSKYVLSHEGRVDVMTERENNGQRLWHKRDPWRSNDDPNRRKVVVRAKGSGRAVLNEQTARESAAEAPAMIRMEEALKETRVPFHRAKRLAEMPEVQFRETLLKQRGWASRYLKGGTTDPKREVRLAYEHEFHRRSALTAGSCGRP